MVVIENNGQHTHTYSFIPFATYKNKAIGKDNVVWKCSLPLKDSILLVYYGLTMSLKTYYVICSYTQSNVHGFAWFRVNFYNGPKVSSLMQLVNQQ